MYIEHIIEPAKLLLSWQSPKGQDRQRHIVAELRHEGDDAKLVYLRESPDYVGAIEKGFDGEYPGFPATQDHSGVLAAFLKRLPPPNRTDFSQFLNAIRIRPEASISRFALLGYAGGKLPGDEFYIIHPFDEASPPFEFLLLTAGYRHYREKVPYEALKIGMPVSFLPEPDNQYDPNAVRIVIPDASESTAGYVCRGLLPQFRRWLAEGLDVKATVERLNGATEHPLVFLFVTVRAAR